jgi:hypothetical protein
MPVPSTGFDVDLSLYDDFSRYSDGVAMNGQSPIVGATWVTTGADLPKIQNHYLISDGIGYLYSIQSTPVNEIGCDIVWSGTAETPQDLVQAMTLTISPDTTTLTLTRMLHFNFGPIGFGLSFGNALGPGAPLQGVTAGTWTVPMKKDGLTAYRVKMTVRGNSVAIFGPNGEVFGWSDSRVSQFVGGMCFFEPTTYKPNGDGTFVLRAMVKRAWAVSQNSNNPPSPFATNDDFAAFGNYFHYGRIVGALNTMGEVDVGVIKASPAESSPQIQFGPTNIITSLAAATIVGATMISTVDYMPAGTPVTIDPGPNQEIVAIGGFTGAAPYGLAVPPLAKAHASGAIVQSMNIFTSLATAAGIGATTISCAAYIPAGSLITIAQETKQDVVATTGVSGTGPYTITVPPLQNAYSAGAVVQSQLPASMQYTVIYDQIARTLRLPVDANGLVSIGGFLFGPDPGSTSRSRLYLDLTEQPGFITSNTGRVRLNETNTFATGVGGIRPTAELKVGDQFYDTNLGIPIWYAGKDGSGHDVWKNAAGTPVV